ncbi:MAG: Hsp20/alpha crystallin family protein [Proteobacteria bacterium]|nr:Hsp20/alpha crystallin family protein [Pseudomonadota bacterium]MBU1137468.1 Hsp20/alpha crystallin family protein [Pseudomonadota bacterium]MBU1234212.1 Hsp20/alpha crystallin family protein [Pseudomonadota bacterium]MBU1419884.1 Hsp20/alpha crystallin family protein [Pseudomonadota bacterium]MBU1453311.1 Hsp20/alpha crystallin family protein [Pseudomonadota bacterium]
MSEKTDIIKRETTVPEYSSQIPAIRPVVDIYENEDELLLFADMPGVAKENISVTVDNGKLVISGVRNLHRPGTVTQEEFSDVKFHRTFSVPQTIDVAKVNAEMKNGVLRLHLPKSEAAKPRQIKIA